MCLACASQRVIYSQHHILDRQRLSRTLTRFSRRDGYIFVFFNYKTECVRPAYQDSHCQSTSFKFYLIIRHSSLVITCLLLILPFSSSALFSIPPYSLLLDCHSNLVILYTTCFVFLKVYTLFLSLMSFGGAIT